MIVTLPLVEVTENAGPPKKGAPTFVAILTSPVALTDPVTVFMLPVPEVVIEPPLLIRFAIVNCGPLTIGASILMLFGPASPFVVMLVV